MITQKCLLDLAMHCTCGPKLNVHKFTHHTICICRSSWKRSKTNQNMLRTMFMIHKRTASTHATQAIQDPLQRTTNVHSTSPLGGELHSKQSPPSNKLTSPRLPQSHFELHHPPSAGHLQNATPLLVVTAS